MVFSSPLFLSIFLPVLLAIYFLSGTRFRNYILLGASLFFYAWGEPRAIFLMLAMIVVNFGIARRISTTLDTGSNSHAKAWLTFGLVLDLISLGVFKYASFIVANVNLISGWTLSDPEISLPIGISFYLFQIISYLIDVYRRDTGCERSLLDFALYVSLFPQLIAGPIVRYRTISSEIRDRDSHWGNIRAGLQRFSTGLAKKVLIADVAAYAADAIFKTQPQDLPCFFAWVGVFAYSLQIFFDFSGYSDMAIGLGKVFNFHFLENFDYPYSSVSIREFWRRWHISLSTWFRDYLYIPLGGSRCTAFRTYLNLLIVFVLCGLWHGASWCFVVWGLWHGAGLVIERLLVHSRFADKIKMPRIVGNIYVWVFVLVGWVFFRSPTIAYATGYLRVMFTGNQNAPLMSYWTALTFYTHSLVLTAAAGLALSYPAVGTRIAVLGNCRRGDVLTLILFGIAYVFAMTSGYSPFIYFRF